MNNWVEAAATSSYRKVLLYGAPGLGKTTGVITAPGPIRILDPENSSLAIAGLGEKYGVKVRRVGTYMDCQYALQELTDEKVKDGTIAFDTLTQIQRLHIRELSGAGIPGRREYYHDTYGLGRMYTAFAKLPMHVIYICGQDTQRVGEGDNARSIFVPDLTPSLMKDLLQICDGCGYMFLDTKGDRCLTFDPSRDWYAKRRATTLPKGVITCERMIPELGFKIHDWSKIFTMMGVKT